MREEHEEEREVLQSIYEGDDCYSMINDTTFQYKVKSVHQHVSCVCALTTGLVILCNLS